MDVSSVLEKNPKATEKINKLAAKGRVAELLIDAGKHDGITFLTKHMEERVNGINHMMCWNYKAVDGKRVRLSENERIELEAERSALMGIIEIFPTAEAQLANIEKKLQSYER